MCRAYVITGSASGIGATTARLLAEAGHRVIGVDLREADVTADLSRAEDRTRAAAEAAELAGGTVDAVIACAGISSPIPATASINYVGVVELLGALLPALERSEAQSRCCRNRCRRRPGDLPLEETPPLRPPVGPEGIEPSTRGLKVRCSAD